MEPFENRGARCSGMDEAECRGVAGEVIRNGGCDCGGEFGLKKPLSWCRIGETVGVIAGEGEESAPIMGESGGVRGRFAKGDGWCVKVRVFDGLADAVGGR